MVGIVLKCPVATCEPNGLQTVSFVMNISWLCSSSLSHFSVNFNKRINQPDVCCVPGINMSCLYCCSMLSRARYHTECTEYFSEDIYSLNKWNPSTPKIAALKKLCFPCTFPANTRDFAIVCRYQKWANQMMWPICGLPVCGFLWY